jgi:hypothetical protein
LTAVSSSSTSSSNPPSNRGFWLVAGGFLIVGAVIVTGAILSAPDPPSSSVRTNLQLALRAANVVRHQSGTLSAATASEMDVVEVRLTFVDGNEPSTGPTVVSVRAEADVWVAAAAETDGTCRAVRMDAYTVDAGLVDVRPCSADAVAGAATSLVETPPRIGSPVSPLIAEGGCDVHRRHRER